MATLRADFWPETRGFELILGRAEAAKTSLNFSRSSLNIQETLNEASAKINHQLPCNSVTGKTKC